MGNRFAGFEQEVRGPWQPKWYAGAVMDGYETTGQFAAVHKTQDKPTQTGDSRNLKLCVTVVNGKGTLNLNYTVNYRPEALEPERIEELKAARERYKDIRGAWPDKLAQRDNLSLSRLHELERAGIPLEDAEDGGFNTDKMLGKAADWRLGVHRMLEGTKDSETVPQDVLKSATDEEKARFFNKITGVAALDTKVGK